MNKVSQTSGKEKHNTLADYKVTSTLKTLYRRIRNYQVQQDNCLIGKEKKQTKKLKRTGIKSPSLQSNSVNTSFFSYSSRKQFTKPIKKLISFDEVPLNSNHKWLLLKISFFLLFPYLLKLISSPENLMALQI